MLVHRFLRVTPDAECPVILFSIIIFLCIYMMSMQKFAVGRMTEIYPAALASPAILSSIAMAEFSKAMTIFVDRRGIVGVQW